MYFVKTDPCFLCNSLFINELTHPKSSSLFPHQRNGFAPLPSGVRGRDNSQQQQKSSLVPLPRTIGRKDSRSNLSPARGEAEALEAEGLLLACHRQTAGCNPEPAHIAGFTWWWRRRRHPAVNGTLWESQPVILSGLLKVPA